MKPPSVTFSQTGPVKDAITAPHVNLTGTHAGRSSRMRAVVERGSNSRFFLLAVAEGS